MASTPTPGDGPNSSASSAKPKKLNPNLNYDPRLHQRAGRGRKPVLLGVLFALVGVMAASPIYAYYKMNSNTRTGKRS